MKVLFLCRGNVGRSVFAEYLYNSITLSKDASSAGTKLSGPEEPTKQLKPAEFVFEVLEEEGVDASRHIRRNVTKDMIEDADVVVDMAEPETVPSFVKKHPKRIVWKIDDPKGKSLEKHLRIKNEIKDKVRKFLNP